MFLYKDNQNYVPPPKKKEKTLIKIKYKCQKKEKVELENYVNTHFFNIKKLTSGPSTESI